jgi:hypothetical protein
MDLHFCSVSEHFQFTVHPYSPQEKTVQRMTISSKTLNRMEPVKSGVDTVFAGAAVLNPYRWQEILS